MKSFLSLLLCGILIVTLFPGCSQASSGSETTHTLQVGYARVDITPQEPVPLRGLGGDTSERMSEDIRDPLYATCIAFTDETGLSILLYELDLALCFGMPTLNARSDVAKATGVPMNQIMVTATHNHSGPDLDNTKEPSMERYAESLRKWMVEAAEAALADRKIATGMFSASAEPENMNFCRHYVMDDGSICGDNFKGTGKVRVSHVVDADNQLQLVKFTRENGKDVVLMNWQGHPRGHKDYRNSILSDVDIIRKKVEAGLDCHFIYFLGASGNLNNSSHIKEEQITKNYLEHNEKLGQYAIDAAAQFQELQIGKLQIIGQNYRCTAKANSNVKMDVAMFVFSFGDLAFAAAPYEMFSENGDDLKNGSPFKTTFIATCANNMLYYVPSVATFEYGGYEVEKSRLASGSAELLVNEYITMLKQIHHTSHES